MSIRVIVLWLAGVCVCAAQQGFSGGRALDSTIEEAIRAGELPGAVVLVWQRGVTLYRKAYGQRALVPRREAMTVDTIFDIASLTKVVATAPCLMKLIEEGKIRLNDRVTQYLPEFQGGKSEITVRNLLTHFSGLRGDVDLSPPWQGYETGIKLALIDKPIATPGERFIYSDINFVLLGEIVRRLSGKPLNEYAAEVVFKPLGMSRTTFLPPARWIPRIAPTEGAGRGVVHDPTARNMGGVAGHAGVFSTADDLAKFAEMMVGMGETLQSASPRHLFSSAMVRRFTTPQSPPDQPILRGLGWDIDSTYAGPRGDLFPIGSYGHTGFTGTSMWIDPSSESFVILLANSVHPRPRAALTSLRGRVASIVAAAVGAEGGLAGYNETLASAGVRRAVARNAQVLTGLDVLEEQHFAPLGGLRVGLITNHTGLSRNGRRGVDAMLAAEIDVRALFSPEHGIGGQQEDENIANSKDAATGVPIFSLYAGENRRPSAEALRELDVLVYDVQDVGARFYTYVSTMGYAMEEAARRGIPFFVLDRPNPINGVRVEGPMLDKESLSFIGYSPIPLRYAMTVGELAKMLNTENGIGVDLHVVPMRGWQRGDWFDSTGLVWIDPSPNLRSLNAATLYPGVAMLEFSRDYSVGRGTDAPFEQIGAPWIRGQELAAYLNARFVPGVRVYATRFRPTASACVGLLVEGVRFVVTDREAFSAQRLGLEIAAALMKLYPGKLSLEANRRLIGNSSVMAALNEGREPRAIEQESQEGLEGFLKVRQKYLIY